MKTPTPKRFSCLILLSALLMPTAPAGEMYRFGIDPDGLKGAPACKLNSPIEGKDRIHIRDGHFYTVGNDRIENTADDRRMRFWGINLSAPLTFPRTAAEAERIAARLAKLGINIVRLHSFDGSKTGADYMTVLDTKAHYPLMNETNLKCLDRLIKAFMDHGIYVDFALHVAYTFEPNDFYVDKSGAHHVPDPTKTTKRYAKARPIPRGSKPLLMFNREMIELQKRFAGALLKRTNHITGLRYMDDPTVALLELNNEASLVEQFHKETENYPPLYAEELDDLWNQWLRKKYDHDQSLSSAWEFKGKTSNPPNLRNGGFDDAPGSAPAHWTLERIKDHWPPGATSGPKINDWGECRVNEKHALEVTVSKVPPTYWHIFVAQKGISFSEGNSYKIRFNAWADAARKIQVSCQGGSRLSKHAFRKKTVAITTAPTFYEFSFTSRLSDTNCRLNFLPLTSDHPFKPGENAGRMWIDDVSITAIQPCDLLPGESFSADEGRGNVARRVKARQLSPARRKDYLAFLQDVERNYYTEMKTHLKETVGAKQPITGSQSDYGGLLGHKNMSDLMDFVDTHFYYDHCDFPPAPRWSEWTYRNIPMVEHPSESVVSALAAERTLGKPFTITEYGLNPFNQYAVESHAIAAAYAALQDMDIIFLFQYYRGYKDYRDDMNPDKLTGVHNILADTRAEALMNLSANIFRRGDVSAAANVVRIPIRDDQAFHQVYEGRNIRSLQSWLEHCPELKDPDQRRFDPRMGLISGIGLQHTDKRLTDRFPGLPAAQKDPLTGGDRTVYESDTGELKWACYARKGRSYFCLDTDRSKAVVGYLRKTLRLNGATITGTGGDAQFGIVSITSLDGKPVTTSSSLLVSALGGKGKSRNVEAVEVDPARKRYRLMGANNLPFYGKNAGPFEIESNPVVINLLSTASSITVKRLNTSGGVVSLNTIPKYNGRFEFAVGSAADRTPWYLVTAVQADPARIEAEDSVEIIPAENGVAEDPDASGGRCVALTTNGSMSVAIPDTVPPGRYCVNVRARATEFEGCPQVKTYVNGKCLDTLYISDANKSWQTYSLSSQPVEIPGGPKRTIRIEFINDKKSGALDRNVYIDHISLYGL